MIKLTIVVPVYNGAEHITECLQSICEQTESSLELLILDDGSKDNSAEVIRHFIEENETKLQVSFRQQENQGVAITRNTGIQLAQGEYITFIDQDDRIAPDYCANYLQEAADSDIVIGGYERVTYSGKILKKVSLGKNVWEKFIVVAPWAHLYRTDFLKDNNINFLSTGIGEDVYFNMLAYAATDKIKTIGDTGYQWMFNENSVSNSKQNSINEKVDPVYLLDCIVKDADDKSFLQDEMTEYYFVRYICWYMLFSVRGSRRSDVSKMYDRLKKWLRQNYPAYKKNRYLLWHSPKGEILSTGMIVHVFYMADRLGIMKRLLLLIARKG